MIEVLRKAFNAGWDAYRHNTEGTHRDQEAAFHTWLLDLEEDEGT